MKKICFIISCLFIALFSSVYVNADVSRVSKITNTTGPAEGKYYIVSKTNPNYCLVIKGYSSATGAIPALVPVDEAKVMTATTNRWIWYLNKDTGNTYDLINYYSGKLIGAKNNTKAVNGVIRQNRNNRCNGQRWYIMKNYGSYIIQSSISKLVMGQKNYSVKNGSTSLLQKWGNKKGQKWRFIKYDTKKSLKQLLIEQKLISAPTTKTTTITTTTKAPSASQSKTSSKTGMSEEDYAVLNNILGAVETGGQVYGKRDYGDYTAPYTCSSIEHTCTLGWGAFYGDEAELLVKMIKMRNPSVFAQIDKKGIIAKKLSVNWVNTRWKPNATEINLLKQLITTDTGKKIQDELMTSLMKVYVSKCTSLYTKNTHAIMMYCEIAHLGGTNAANRIFDKCQENYSLDSIMKALQTEYNTANSVGSSKFWSRHEKCVEFIERYA